MVENERPVAIGKKEATLEIAVSDLRDKINSGLSEWPEFERGVCVSYLQEQIFNLHNQDYNYYPLSKEEILERFWNGQLGEVEFSKDGRRYFVKLKKRPNFETLTFGEKIDITTRSLKAFRKEYRAGGYHGLPEHDPTATPHPMVEVGYYDNKKGHRHHRVAFYTLIDTSEGSNYYLKHRSVVGFPLSHGRDYMHAVPINTLTAIRKTREFVNQTFQKA